MALKEQRVLVFSDADILKVRRLAREMAVTAGFDRIATVEIETVVSELAGNIIKHRAVDGEIILCILDDGEKQGIEVRSLDRGPGIKDVEAAIYDGVSSAGGLGIGLSGVKRLMDEFSIESQLHKMTEVAARKWLCVEGPPKLRFSVIARPKQGEDVSGDAYFIRQNPNGVFFTVMDALGHGREAFETSRKALAVIEERYDESLPRIIELCHRELRGSRGIAIALCRIDFKRLRLQHLSIGNVETRVFGTKEPVRPFCFNGTLGMSIENYHVRDYPWTEGAIIVIHSDGVAGHFDILPERFNSGPQEIAAHIFDNFARKYDDATVLVGR